ncbi:MAG: GDP-mannose 4,6-dehydratase [bacterium]|nr:GDP-mannose 4,6-dehydratase [bacterium]
MAKKRALVTGGAGFIGSHVVDALVKRGYAVTVIDDLSSGRRDQVNPKAVFIKMDIRKPKVHDAIVEIAPHFIFHFAAQIDARFSVRDPVFDADVNVLGSIRILEAARAVQAEKFIFASSGGAIYGGARTRPTPETYEAHPRSPYGVSKLSFEHYLHAAAHTHDFPYVALRFANVYGPRQSNRGEAGVIAVFTTKMLHGEQPVINGDGKQTRDFVYVDDIVRAAMSATKPKARGIFNIGTGRETTINEIFYQLRALTGAPCEIEHTAAKPGEERRSVLDHSKARRALGWNPTVSLKEGLKKTVAWFTLLVE